MKSLFIVCLFSVTVLGAKLDGLEHHDHDHDHHHDHDHDFPLATGREAAEASARLLEFFDAVYNDDQFPADMPSYNEIPTNIQFSCDGRVPGYYADVDYGCQLYHICRDDPEHSVASFLCPNATIFHQQIFACDWWFNVDCLESPNFFHLNDDLYKDPSELDQLESRFKRSALLPTDGYIPPKQGYLPPDNGYLPPKPDYLPPKPDYLPPKPDYLPPKKDYLPPN